MTSELKRAMARYEEARVRYRKAVLASLDGASNGDVIRQSIRDFQRASAELKRLAPPAAVPARPLPAPEVRPEPAEALATAWSSVRRAVSGVGARLRIMRTAS
ncbi:hypothetical protein [Anaeromyxobacter diazotrophicus]|uniref:Uncharacterized protein n=1 Tax=Anaeromyxobacter diazotrophicus TaxID=2590199 RepID=A0A7I9VI96_9BACT|nr:hypothetical protein [Anaeromyxobacter diazotrophicus]GEJ56136.1 hypothetical protein AMYX_08770 [Anaeromyxobacter diazotrophicus]